MKKLVVLLMAMLVATTAFAQIDPDPNMMGIYFDQEAMTTCGTFGAYTDAVAYLCLTNPGFDSWKGFECNLTVTGNYIARDVMYVGEALDLGAAGSGDFLVGLANPLPTAPVTVLFSREYFLMDGESVRFDLAGAIESSNDDGVPMMLESLGPDNTQLVPTGFSTIDGMGCAFINAPDCAVVATQSVSFDSIKSLYR